MEFRFSNFCSSFKAKEMAQKVKNFMQRLFEQYLAMEINPSVDVPPLKVLMFRWLMWEKLILFLRKQKVLAEILERKGQYGF